MQEVTTLTQEPKKRVKPSVNWLKILPWLVPFAFLMSWQAAVSFNWVTSSLIPAPSTVIQDGISLWQSGELPKNIAISLYRATAGFAIGGSVGFALGLINGLVKPIRALLDSPIQMLRNIPHLSLIPLMIILMGIGEPAKIALVAIGVMFPMYINTYQGIVGADPELLEMGRAYGLSRRALFTRVVFPGALANILMGVRYALGVMWTTLIVAETISATSGLGYMATNAQEFMRMDTVLLCILIYALLGKLSDMIAKSLERLFLGWRQGGTEND
ncbi:ABC transporter permease subunit [Lacticaseibacillus rhamnosus]|uniref:ABC transporter permease subunit n=1 Tax=Lacticaseibacillus rhamnosus TaxID=47715 RepID=UPI0023E2E50B|nr:ABC transporter permease subunit [Lacticaseibacillus rhamnosus]MDF3334448.1 ABC transporter permease subunit [Lacticaseibacillus rhamnosus]